MTVLLVGWDVAAGGLVMTLLLFWGPGKRRVWPQDDTSMGQLRMASCLEAVEGLDCGVAVGVFYWGVAFSYYEAGLEIGGAGGV